MKTKQLIKGLAVALPMLTLAACSSTDQTTDAGDVEQNMPAEQTTVETGTLEPVLSAEELIAEQKAALMEENTIYFAFDNDQIGSEYMDVLEAHATFLRENPKVAIIIEGHADERGTPEYNIALGQRRGDSVSTYMMSMGVGYDQIEVVSYGEEKPAVAGHTETSWAKNRRAVLSY